LPFRIMSPLPSRASWTLTLAAFTRSGPISTISKELVCWGAIFSSRARILDLSPTSRQSARSSCLARIAASRTDSVCAAEMITVPRRLAFTALTISSKFLYMSVLRYPRQAQVLYFSINSSTRASSSGLRSDRIFFSASFWIWRTLSRESPIFSAIRAKFWVSCPAFRP